MSWEEFASKVRTHQRGFMGEPKEVRPGRGEFHENPSTCICETTEATTAAYSNSLSQSNVDDTHGKGKEGKGIVEPTSDHADDEPDWSEMDYGEYTPLGEISFNHTEMDYDPSGRTEDSELEDILSD